MGKRPPMECKTVAMIVERIKRPSLGQGTGLDQNEVPKLVGHYRGATAQHHFDPRVPDA